MDHFSKNLQALAVKNPALAQSLPPIPLSGVQISQSKNGLPNLLEQDSQGNWHPLHSNYDPIREAADRAQTTALDPQALCVLLGFGAGYLLEALVKLPVALHTHFLVLEPNRALFKEALISRDLSHLLSRPNVDFLVGVNLGELENMGATPREKCLKTPVVIANFASTRLWGEFYEQATFFIHNEIKRLIWQIHNLAVAAPLFFENFLQNLVASLEDGGVRDLEGLFPGIPALVVGAGPSLDKNIHLIAGISDRVVVLTTDAAAKPLQAAGVEPHFIVTVDPQYICHHHLSGLDFSRTSLVYEISSQPANLPLFAGRRFAALLQDTTFHFLWDQLEDKGSIKGWGSVSTLAFYLAQHMGCRPILFVGQDLSFTGGRAFAREVEFQKNQAQGIRTEEELLARYEGQCKGSDDVIQIMDIFGRPTLSTQRLQAYGHYLSRAITEDSRVPCINATGGGIFQQGVLQMSLKEALFRYAQAECDLWARIPKVGHLRTKTRKLERYLADMFVQAEELRKENRKAIKKLEEWLVPATPGQSVAYEFVRHWFQDLLSQAGRFQQAWKFLDLFIQKPLYDFSVTEYSARENAEMEIRRCLNYLQALDGMIDKVFPRLHTFARELKTKRSSPVGRLPSDSI